MWRKWSDLTNDEELTSIEVADGLTIGDDERKQSRKTPEFWVWGAAGLVTPSPEVASPGRGRVVPRKGRLRVSFAASTWNYQLSSRIPVPVNQRRDRCQRWKFARCLCKESN